MDTGSRKVQARWNISLETSSRRELVGFAANYRVRYGYSCRCLDPAGIPALEWYSMPLWIKLKTEPPIVSSIIDLMQAREGCRCQDKISTTMYGKMLIMRNRV